MQDTRTRRSVACGIFISHASQDHDATAVIASRLDGWGFQSLFLDFDPEYGIPAGRDWEREIYRQIGASGAMVALCSRNSAQSKWCFAERAQARALGKELFPITLDDAPVEPLLRDRQAIDIREGESVFERLRRGLHEAGLDPGDDFQWNRSRDPYPGLNVFTEDDAGVFFGRDELIRESLDRLNQMVNVGGPRLALALGASGSGKSSLVRAGIIPRLKKPGRNWVVVPPVLPGTTPIRAIAQAFASVPPNPQWRALRDSLMTNDDSAKQAVADACAGAALAAGAHQAPVLIVIDQFEEALVASPSDEVQAFHRMLRGVLDADVGAVYVLATLRSDFLPQFQNHAAWRGVKPTLIDVRSVPLQNLPDIIEGPAARAGLDVEPALVQSMIQDAGTNDVLPLLAFALREIYVRCTPLGRLTLEAYRTGLNGLQAAETALHGRAHDQQPVAESRGLGAEAELVANTDGSAALGLAIRSWQTAGTEEPRQAIADAFCELVVLEGHQGDVHHAELSPDGALVLMASVDRSARAGACCIGALDDAAQTVEIAEIAAPGSERAANACVDRVLRMIAARYHDPHLSLSVVAREVRFSTWHVSRTLTHRTGLGFVAHLRRARVTAARRLLVQSVLSMKEIAAAVGYPHPNRLDRDFRRMCSVTPSTFRHERVTGRHSSAERQETMRDRKK